MQQVDCLLSTSYAKEWIESFPIGNGHIGVMDNGAPHDSIITLNDDTLWSGYNANFNKDVSNEIWQEIRTAVEKNNLSKAESLIHKHVLSDWHDTYLPLGQIDITRELGLSSVDNYKRILDMSTGVHEVSFNVDNIAYKRTSFVSAVDKVLAMNITTSLPDSATITMSSKLAAETVPNKKDMTIALYGKAPSYVAPIYHSTKDTVIYDSTKPSLDYYAMMKIITNGEVNQVDGGFYIKNYTSIKVIYSSATSFDIKAPLQDYVFNIVAKANKIPFERLLNSHILDFTRLYNRAKITLDYRSPNSIISTEDLMKRFAQDDSYLEAVICLFNLGRYLMISGSRKGTQAMNLQGIWNDTLRPPWCSNYTLNINTEMNYWGAEIVNLSECHEPLFDFIKRVHVNGQETARRTYGIDGFTIAHNSDLWAHTSPVGGQAMGSSACCYGLNISTAGWLCSHLFMHYEFTNDIEFLADIAYPIMKDAARFYLDYMTVDKTTNYLVPSPSASPENHFVQGFKWHSVCKASTMDLAVIKTLFKQILKASDILGDTSPIVKDITEALPRIYPYKINKKGRLQEWNEDYRETEKCHRHISHLYSIFPSNEITMTKEPKLAKACQETLKRRTNKGTGWSMAWKINVSARLHDGENAFELIKRQLTLVPATKNITMSKGGSFKNMLCAHPPFQIDGNFGAMSGIAEMLIQSHDNVVELLPALPTKWHNGEFKGLCARGGYVVNLKWRNNNVTEFYVESNYRSEVGIKIGDIIKVYKTNTTIKL